MDEVKSHKQIYLDHCLFCGETTEMFTGKRRAEYLVMCERCGFNIAFNRNEDGRWVISVWSESDGLDDMTEDRVREIVREEMERPLNREAMDAASKYIKAEIQKRLTFEEKGAPEAKRDNLPA